MKKTTIFGIIILVLGVLLALIPQVLLPVCDKTLELANGNTVPMACHWTGLFATAAGILIALTGLLAAAFRRAQTSVVLGIQSAALACITMLISTVIIGVCKSATMPCHMGTQPAILVICILIILLSALLIGSGIKNRRKED